jgi:hypothetical protein
MILKTQESDIDLVRKPPKNMLFTHLSGIANDMSFWPIVRQWFSDYLVLRTSSQMVISISRISKYE